MQNYAIITKSDSNFFKGLVALVESIKGYETQTPIIVIDCGLTKEELAYFKNNNWFMLYHNIVVILETVHQC